MLNNKSTFCSLIVLTLVLHPGILLADKQKTTAPPPKKTVMIPVYKPPLRGAPASRIGGGTRGNEHNNVQLTALSPDHTGLTTMASPTLYWHATAQSNYPLEITIVNEQTLETVLEVQNGNAIKPGINKINLAEHGIELQTGIEYRWFVTLVPDQNQRSNDIIASATIKRINAPATLTARLADNKHSARPVIQAEEGIWYDAIDGLSKMIPTNTGSSEAARQRSELLEQVGIQLR